MTTRYTSFDIETPHPVHSRYRTISKYSNPIVSCFMCLFSVVNFLMLLIILTRYTFSFDQDFSKLLPTIDYISENLDSPPITSIQKSTNLACPSGYTLQKLITWPGTIKGCYCPQRGSIYPGDCASGDSGVCQTVDPVEDKDLFIWNNDAYCVKRSQKYLLKPYNQSCPSGYNDCQNFCVKQGESCPITSLRIIGQSGETANANESITLSQNRALVINRNEVGLEPLYNLKISFYDMPCLQVDYLPTTNAQGTNYVLLNIPTYSGCGSFGFDNSTEILESINALTVFNQNKFTSIEKLPLYLEQQKEASAYLVTVPKVSIQRSQHCQDLAIQKDIDTIKDHIEAFQGWLIVGSVLGIVCMFVYWIYLVYLIANGGVRKFYLNLTRKVISWCVFSAAFALILIYNRLLAFHDQKIIDQKAYYAELGTSNCFDTSLSAIFIEFSQHISTSTTEVMRYINTMFWSSLGFYIASALIIIFRIVYNTCFM